MSRYLSRLLKTQEAPRSEGETEGTFPGTNVRFVLR
jgi:hypothetical protein